MGEDLLNLLRMHDSPLAHEIQHLLRTLAPSTGPGQVAPDRNPAIRPWMHQRLQLARHESVIDEKVFLDSEPAPTKTPVTPLQVAGPIVFHPMPQDQILRPRRSTNRIGLHKFHPVQCPLERSRWE